MQSRSALRKATEYASQNCRAGTKYIFLLENQKNPWKNLQFFAVEHETCNKTFLKTLCQMTSVSRAIEFHQSPTKRHWTMFQIFFQHFWRKKPCIMIGSAYIDHVEQKHCPQTDQRNIKQTEMFSVHGRHSEWLFITWVNSRSREMFRCQELTRIWHDKASKCFIWHNQTTQVHHRTVFRTRKASKIFLLLRKTFLSKKNLWLLIILGPNRIYPLFIAYIGWLLWI